MIYEVNASTMPDVTTTLNGLHQLLSHALEGAHCTYLPPPIVIVSGVKVVVSNIQ